MRKSDLITLDDNLTLSYDYMGLFDTETDWIHPTVTVDSYELIYVTEGNVHIKEGETRYDLNKGEMLLLCPHVEHGGTQISRGHTAFFWLHFYCNDVCALKIPKLSSPTEHEALRTFNELMHLSKTSRILTELTLAKFLLGLSSENEYHSRLAYELDEYIRINSRRRLSVTDISNRFGYSPDYVSRVYKREYGYDIKSGIIKQRLAYIESLLINTDYSVKEIAAMCGFDDENNFVKFFKYHEHTTPTLFRNKFFYVHMNNR